LGVSLDLLLATPSSHFASKKVKGLGW
jgi:hypothetical protein